MNKWPILLFVFILYSCGRNNQQNDFRFPSHIDFISSRGELLIASERSKQIAIVDIGNFGVKKKISLEKSPTGFAIPENEKSIYVSAGLNDGVVYIIAGGICYRKSDIYKTVAAAVLLCRAGN